MAGGYRPEKWFGCRLTAYERLVTMLASTSANIVTALKQLQGRHDIAAASRELLRTLGYESCRQHESRGKDEFFDWLYAAQPLDREKALASQIRNAALIFQVTGNEMPGDDGTNLLQEADGNTHIKSYLFVAVSLQNKGDDDVYTRSELAAMTRALNKPLSVPVFLFIYHDGNLSLSIVHRRPARRSNRPDAVLEKVSIIKDISLTAPCRAHAELLSALSLGAVKNAAKNKDRLTFADVHRLWLKTLDTKPLNEQFYAEISDWFFWACKTVKLPYVPDYLIERYKRKGEKDQAKAANENVRMFNLRLLCRMIFAWFMKERRLIEPELLDLYDAFGAVQDCLFDDAPDAEGFDDHNGYYRGILQNIFFNCLNTPQDMRKVEKGRRVYDKWARDEAAKAHDYRGKQHLPPGFDYDKYFGHVPYLNGGLFDVLEEDCAKQEIEDAVISVPNKLFYAKKHGGFKERGLNVILADYKFTIEENTPLEEDVALDPELLGMVFENLLAALDSEDEKAASAARKASGSFYTPRRVVDYMVNESLRLYLETWMRRHAPACEAKVAALLYSNAFDTSDALFADQVVSALDALRILDPACGSGAFPMGMLHHIVNLLRTVDPRNKLWLRHQLERLEPEFREQVRGDLERHAGDYSRKHGIIRNAIHGVDILPMAATITKLRFFISLLVEQKVDRRKPNYGLSPLPNLETKILCANSLVDLQGDLFSAQAVKAYRDARVRYFRPGATHTEREQLADQIADILAGMYPQFAEQVFGSGTGDAASDQRRNRKCLRDWFLHANVAAPFFNMSAFFPEAADADGFDIVIGNPPYGGTPISKDLQASLDLGSRDPYGAFIARFMGDGYRQTPLKTHGVLSYIVSDTFMTIKTHRLLREQLLRHRIHKMVRVNKDTFGATVNTAIILLQSCRHAAGASFDACLPPDQLCQMVDLTNISLHDDYERFLNLLFATALDRKGADISTESCAVYHYPQTLIASNSNLPFFVASPKLFSLMNDTSAPSKHEQIGGRNVPVRTICINGRDVRLVKLGDIAEVKVGLQTGDNDAYLFQNPEARGTYRSISDYSEFLLTDEDLARIRDNDELRLAVIKNGIVKDDKNSPRYFGGRYIVPYDKGGESDSDEGWMPNYWVPTNYFIRWDEVAVDCLMNNDRLRLASTQPYPRNPEYYFKYGVSFSDTGEYSPTFRLGFGSVFDQKGSCIFSFTSPTKYMLGWLASKIYRYFMRSVVNQTISSHVNCQKEIFLPIEQPSSISKLVKRILAKQKQNPRYDYASNEQLEIDRLVYEAYGLNEDDIAEVETWYARRYAKLAAAQRENLRKLGKREPWLRHWDHFCDESGHLLRNDLPYMALGMLSCPQEARRRLNRALKALKQKHGIPEKREIKWVGVSPARQDFYKALVDLFFDEPDVRFSVLLVLKPPMEKFFETVPVESAALDAPESVRLVSPLYDDWYYQNYFDLIWGTIHPAHRHHIMVDSKDTRSGARVNTLQERLNEALFDYLGKTVPDVTLVDTKETPLSQLSDFLIGLAAFANQGIGQSAAKKALVSHFEKRLGAPLTEGLDGNTSGKVKLRFAAGPVKVESEVAP